VVDWVAPLEPGLVARVGAVEPAEAARVAEFGEFLFCGEEVLEAGLVEEVEG
jgi:hypothetical protein